MENKYSLPKKGGFHCPHREEMGLSVSGDRIIKGVRLCARDFGPVFKGGQLFLAVTDDRSILALELF